MTHWPFARTCPTQHNPQIDYAHSPGKTASMTTTNTVFPPSSGLTSIPVREILPWAVFVGLLALLALYFVGAEQGATSLIPGMYVHEFVHDGRHLLGFPCH